MKVYVSRESVCAGDDIESHGKTFTFPDNYSVEEVLQAIIDSGYLPSVSGGCATWTAASNIPIAVIANEWSSPRIVGMANDRKNEFDYEKNTLRIHLNYHGQIDPEIVYKVFWGFQLNAT